MHRLGLSEKPAYRGDWAGARAGMSMYIHSAIRGCEEPGNVAGTGRSCGAGS